MIQKPKPKVTAPKAAPKSVSKKVVPIENQVIVKKKVQTAESWKRAMMAKLKKGSKKSAAA